jgi:fluoroquinolone transport system permease protein
VYRLAMPVLLSVVMTLLSFPLAALVDVSFISLLVIALVTAPQAPLFALFLAAFAHNKVQGFALMKAAGVLLLPPIVAHFVPFPWHLAFGLAPTYWPARLFWVAQAGDPGYWVYVVVGLAYQLMLLFLLLRRFDRVVHQ